ncbi:primosomal protein N' [Helicobacter sp. 13S00477-4]|uniref:primosomal protein N' n=1 Tax=Helicobacter sp. 13S00477-4 TaxID=1905759 RepID=UPI000BA5E683|nr:primosomal protein N' [Helicobacter sp. 13S00477-4]PAF51498.1 primosomal protein N' [Helicobacter sp. 13S00477-4]
MNYYQIAPLKVNSPIFTYQSPNTFQKGDIVNIYIKNKKTQGVILSDCQKPNFTCREATKTPYYFGYNQIILADFIAQYYCCSYGEAYGLFIPFETNHLDSIILPTDSYSTNPLNIHQEKALKTIQNQPFSLLFGDTGSGKTEIYIQLLIQTISKKKNAFFLMPEISLTPQIEERLKNVFGDIVGIWHSKISAKKKKEILQKIQTSQIRIIAGARSALFLPLPNLSLIIIDEEHDDAYKSQNRPTYNARDISLYLGKKNKIKIILGSATPSLTSYENAKKTNSLIRLKGRHFDSKKEILYENHLTQITPFILNHLEKTLKQKKQAIIFLPTRANFKTILCQNCAQSIQCPFCSIDMSLHLGKKILCCHYCNYTLPIPSYCPNCKNHDLSTKRLGTAQVALELQELLPQASIAIFDKDHTNTQNKLKKILNDFNHKKIDILIGTQMISKGHDYHSVSLSVILGIDYLLRSGEYRSYEKTLSLIHQLAGRSGRKENGEVILQSLNCDFLKKFMDDYEDFINFELTHRSHSYPPYTKLAMLRFSHVEDEKAKKNMDFIIKILETLKNKEIIIIGAGKCGVEKIASKYRYQIFLRSTSHTAIMKLMHNINSYSQKMGFEIDIDPIQTI